MSKLIFGFPDIHWSYRDEVALDVAIKAHRLLKPQETVIGGDLLDFHAFSHFGSDTPDSEAMVDEVLPATEFLDDLQTRTEKLVVMEGNHERRLSRWLAGLGRGGAALHRVANPRALLVGARKGSRWVPYGDCYSPRPGFLITHGWFTSGNAAQKHLDAVKPSSIIFNHTHRLEYMAETRHSGVVCESLSAGCLCDLHPAYLHGAPSRWAHGFWLAYVGKHSQTMYAIKIRNGSAVLPNGKEVRAG